MTKSKIFVGLGSLVLATSAFIAAKPEKKAFALKTGYAAGFSGVKVIGLTTTPQSGGHTAFFKTIGSVTVTLRTISNGTGKTLFFIP